jgi:hypothetical protein
MTTLAQAVGLSTPNVTRFQRIAPQDDNPYTRRASKPNKAARLARIEFNGFLASSSSTRIAQQVGTETTSTAVLTVLDPTLDLRVGDTVEALPADGRRWVVDGFPAKDVSPFSGWQPTLEATLREIRGGEANG